MKDTKENREVKDYIEQIRRDILEKKKVDYIEDTKVEKELETRKVGESLTGDMDELNHVLKMVSEEYNVSQFDISRKEGGLKKLIAFIYRRILKMILRPYFDRFLHKQERFNSSVVRCLNQSLNQTGRLNNHVKVISVNIRNNNRLIKDMQKAIDNNTEWLDLVKAKIEAHTDELKRLRREYEDTINRFKSQEDLRFKRIEGWLKLIKEKIDINIEE